MEADASLIDALNIMVEDMESDETELSEPTEKTVNGVTMAQVEIKDEESDALAMMSKSGDTYVFAACLAKTGKLADYKDECAAVAASVEVK